MRNDLGSLIQLATDREMGKQSLAIQLSDAFSASFILARGNRSANIRMLELLKRKTGEQVLDTQIMQQIRTQASTEIGQQLALDDPNLSHEYPAINVRALALDEIKLQLDCFEAIFQRKPLNVSSDDTQDIVHAKQKLQQEITTNRTESTARLGRELVFLMAVDDFRNLPPDTNSVSNVPSSVESFQRDPASHPLFTYSFGILGRAERTTGSALLDESLVPCQQSLRELGILEQQRLKRQLLDGPTRRTLPSGPSMLKEVRRAQQKFDRAIS